MSNLSTKAATGPAGPALGPALGRKSRAGPLSKCRPSTTTCRAGGGIRRSCAGDALFCRFFFLPAKEGQTHLTDFYSLLYQ